MLETCHQEIDKLADMSIIVVEVSFNECQTCGTKVTIVDPPVAMHKRLT